LKLDSNVGLGHVCVFWSLRQKVQDHEHVVEITAARLDRPVLQDRKGDLVLFGYTQLSRFLPKRVRKLFFRRSAGVPRQGAGSLDLEINPSANSVRRIARSNWLGGS